jgi:protein-S-isoprenylcysteine O-methyltransferase Ste14
MITGGIYRHSRNPIYLADAMILAGAALLQDVGALVLVPVFMAVISRRFIAGEEAALAARFAGAYREWAGNTRRWL